MYTSGRTDSQNIVFKYTLYVYTCTPVSINVDNGRSEMDYLRPIGIVGFMMCTSWIYDINIMHAIGTPECKCIELLYAHACSDNF